VTSEKQLAAWQFHTVGGFAHRMFEGDHFYVNTKREDLIAQLSSDLQRTRNAG
jgi:surfactin synthase thioesterase subunit